jgi:hypothetical protein
LSYESALKRNLVVELGLEEKVMIMLQDRKVLGKDIVKKLKIPRRSLIRWVKFSCPEYLPKVMTSEILATEKLDMEDHIRGVEKPTPAEKQVSKIAADPVMQKIIDMKKEAKELREKRRELARRMTEEPVQLSDLASSVWNIRGRLDECFALVEQGLATLSWEDGKEPGKVKVMLLGEARQYIALAKDILQMIYDVQDYQDFQYAVIEEIGKASPDLKMQVVNNFRRRLAQRRQLTANIMFGDRPSFEHSTVDGGNLQLTEGEDDD